LYRRKIDIAYVQYTKSMEAKVMEIDGYNLWYLGLSIARNEVSI